MSYFRSRTLEAARSLAKRPAEWSSEQVAIVRRLAADGASAEFIAASLGSISAAAVRGRASKLGIRISSRRAHLGKPVTLSNGQKGRPSRTSHDPYSPWQQHHALAWEK
jgi:hypothetical protein